MTSPNASSAQNAIAPGELVYSSLSGHPWKIFRQDAGMGEFDYAIFQDDEYFCRTASSHRASEIIRAIRFTANMRNAEKHDQIVRDKALSDFVHWSKSSVAAFLLQEYKNQGSPEYQDNSEKINEQRQTSGSAPI